MDNTTDIPYVTSEELPPYRSIFAVDAKGFTEQPGRLHQTISGLIPQLVGKAFAGIGLAEVWNDPTFFGPTGDGFALGVPTRVMPFLVHPLLSELQAVLERHNQSIRAGDPRMQLRVSLNLGPVKEDANPYLGGNGTARNDTHRLLDSVPVKAILAAASPNVTLVAAIISERVYRDVVEQGYTGLHPDHFIEVPAIVDGKNFQQRAWLYVPQLSGNLVTTGVMPVQPGVGSKPSDPKATGSTVVNAPDNQGGIAGTVNGDMNWNTRGRS
jgi:hypothetical protein